VPSQCSVVDTAAAVDAEVVVEVDAAAGAVVATTKAAFPPVRTAWTVVASLMRSPLL